MNAEPSTFPPAALARREFVADQRGVAAVEFALILPVMLLLYLGGIEATQLVSADRKVSLAARVAADLVARDSNATISETTMRTVCKGTLAMLAPFPTGMLNITITAVKTDSKGVSAVEWSRKFTGGNCAASAAGDSKGTAVTPPTGITTNGVSLIWAKIEYDYSMIFDVGTFSLKEEAYMRPRTIDNPGFG